MVLPLTKESFASGLSKGHRLCLNRNRREILLQTSFPAPRHDELTNGKFANMPNVDPAPTILDVFGVHVPLAVAPAHWFPQKVRPMISSSSAIQLRVDKPSGTIILNRPDKKNAITSEMVEKISEAIEDFRQQKSVSSLIIVGSGDYFSSGTDLSELHAKSQEENVFEYWHQDATRFVELIEQMLRFPKPIVAALNGPVMGIANALMLAADIVIASEKATLQFPEAKHGLMPGFSAPLLSFRLGTSQAARLMLTAEPIDAAEAHRIGLFHEIVAADLVWARAHALAQTFQDCAPQSIQMTKQLLNETMGEQLLLALNIAAANLAAARTTDAASEGLQAFAEKRKPKW
jgi:methylglutaconyl-CoA hydratase